MLNVKQGSCEHQLGQGSKPGTGYRLRSERHNKRACRPISILTLLNAERQAGKLWTPTFTVFWSDSTRESNPGLSTTRRTLWPRAGISSSTQVRCYMRKILLYSQKQSEHREFPARNNLNSIHSNVYEEGREKIPEHPVQAHTPGAERRHLAHDHNSVRNPTPASGASDEYDSDLYDTVELDVFGSDGSSSETHRNNPAKPPPSGRSNLKKPYPASDGQSETSSGVSSWSSQARKDDVIKPLDELHIEDSEAYHRGNLPDQRYLSPALRRKLNYSPLSSTSSAPSLSPTPRRVRDDDSWISNKSRPR